MFKSNWPIKYLIMLSDLISVIIYFSLESTFFFIFGHNIYNRILESDQFDLLASNNGELGGQKR